MAKELKLYTILLGKTPLRYDCREGGEEQSEFALNPFLILLGMETHFKTMTYVLLIRCRLINLCCIMVIFLLILNSG